MTNTGEEPILASTLYLATQEVLAAPMLPTGFSALDEILGGGFAYGCISCISATVQDPAAKELALEMLRQHLTSVDDSEATIIDTTLSFDVRGFHRRVVAGLKERGEVDADAQAMNTLKHLRIMKAFDFVGLIECVTELRDGLESDERTQNSKTVAPKGTIEDSQDEGEIAIFDQSSPPSPKTSSLQKVRRLLIIDNITQPVLEQLKMNHIHGQSILSCLLRTLRHLSVTYNLATILTNNATTDNHQIKEESLSIFTSCTLRPALGKSFASTLDLHLLIHDVPKDEASARVIYGEHKGIGECVSVIEILQDRLEGRIGRWVICESRPDGGLKDIARVY